MDLETQKALVKALELRLAQLDMEQFADFDNADLCPLCQRAAMHCGICDPEIQSICEVFGSLKQRLLHRIENGSEKSSAEMQTWLQNRLEQYTAWRLESGVVVSIKTVNLPDAELEIAQKTAAIRQRFS